ARRAHVVAPRARSSALVTAHSSRRETRATPRPIRARLVFLARPLYVLATRRRGRVRRRALARSRPVVLDALTVAARAGCTPRVALAATATWRPPATRGLLVDVERRCRLRGSLSDSLEALSAHAHGP